MVLKCYIFLRFVCFGLPPLLGVEERADRKLFLNPAKSKLHLTSCARFVIFRRVEEITLLLMEILTHLQAQTGREKQEETKA